MIIYDPKITGSFQINGSTISSVGEIDNLSGSVAALNNASSSYLLNTTDVLNGNLTVTGTLTAQEFHTEYTSASIVYQSGSTKFGDSADDVHSFTGSVKISENVDINGTELTIGNSDTRLAENNLRFKSSGDAYIDQYTTNQSIRIRTSNASALDTEAIIITGGGNLLMGNTVVNPASGFADQTGIGLKYSTTTPSLEVSSDSVALNLNRTTTGGAGVIAELRSSNNVRHSFGTATSYMLGNVGIGTTSPNQLLHLDHSGDKNAAIQLGDITTISSNTGIYFRTTGNAYISTASTGTHIFDKAGTERMRINANGNVGIGTNSPTGTYGKLTVNGSISLLDDQNTKLEIGRYSAGASNSYIKLGANSNSLRITNNTDTADLLYIENGGNVELRTVNAQLRFQNSVGPAPFIANTGTGDQALYFSAGGSERMRIDSSGYIGLGNLGQGASVPLHIYQNSSDVNGNNDVMLILQNTLYNSTQSGDTFENKIALGWANHYAAGISAYKQSTNITGLKFYTEFGYNVDEERMRIDGGGNVGINTTNPIDKLQINGNTRVEGVGNRLAFDTTGALGSNYIKTINDYETVIANERGSAGFAVIGNSNIRLGFGTAHTAAQSKVLIQPSGYVGINNTAPAYYLDQAGIGRYGGWKTAAFTGKNVSAGGTAVLQIGGGGTGNVVFVDVIMRVSFVGNGALNSQFGYYKLSVDTQTTGYLPSISQYYNESQGSYQVSTSDFSITTIANNILQITYQNQAFGANSINFYVEGLFHSLSLS